MKTRVLSQASFAVVAGLLYAVAAAPTQVMAAGSMTKDEVAVLNTICNAINDDKLEIDQLDQLKDDEASDLAKVCNLFEGDDGLTAAEFTSSKAMFVSFEDDFAYFETEITQLSLEMVSVDSIHIDLDEDGDEVAEADDDKDGDEVAEAGDDEDGDEVAEAGDDEDGEAAAA